MKRLCLMLMAIFAVACANAQYKQAEYEKYPLQKIFPNVTFDSLAAKHALRKGNTFLKGRAYTTKGSLRRNFWDARIYANHIVVDLLPFTPYVEEWYRLKKKEENLKKNKVVYMDSVAYRYRMDCETNERGEFSFPNLAPGKYILVGTLPWETTESYDKYKGTGYGSYGTSVNYYERQYYYTTHSDFLTQIFEVKEGDTEIKVNLK